MRIDSPAASFYSQIHAPERISVQEKAQSPSKAMGNLAAPGIVVDISPEGWAAYHRNKETERVNAIEKPGSAKSVLPGECKTCKNRSYQDVSDDPSVSFQSATHIDPGQAAARVLAHEHEHVSNEQARADREGRQIISQSVTLQTSFCPECGRMYISGGTTRTVSAEITDS